MSYFDSKIHKHKGLKKAIEGDLGIEIEAEMNAYINGGDNLEFWVKDSDGSLRGPNYEMILKNPCFISEVDTVLEECYNFLNRGSHPDSDNCGVHVHLNVQDRTLYETVIFVVMLIILEPFLVSLCNDTRKGNYFCLSALEAKEIFSVLEMICTGLNINRISTEDYKYAGINLAALSSHGSIELRQLEYPVSQEKLTLWINILYQIRENSLKLCSYNESPDLIFRKISEMGMVGFIREYAPLLSDSTDLNNNELVSMCHSAMRRSQKPVYAMLKHMRSDNLKIPETRRIGEHTADMYVDQAVEILNRGRYLNGGGPRFTISSTDNLREDSFRWENVSPTTSSSISSPSSDILFNPDYTESNANDFPIYRSNSGRICIDVTSLGPLRRSIESGSLMYRHSVFNQELGLRYIDHFGEPKVVTRRSRLVSILRRFLPSDLASQSPGTDARFIEWYDVTIATIKTGLDTLNPSDPNVDTSF